MHTVVGFRILIDGVMRSFRDQHESALAGARQLKAKYKGSRIEIEDESRGTKQEMLEDGRTR